MRVGCLRAEPASSPDRQTPGGHHQGVSTGSAQHLPLRGLGLLCLLPPHEEPHEAPLTGGCSHVRAFGSAQQPLLESDSEPQGGRKEGMKTRGPPTDPQPSLSHVSCQPNSPRPAPGLLYRHGACHSFIRSLPPSKHNASTHSVRQRAQGVQDPVPILKNAVQGDMEAGQRAAHT